MAILIRPSAVTKIIQRLDTIKLSKVRPTTAIKTQNVFCRCTHSVAKRQMAIVSFKLTDIGEGIREVSVKEWFVKEGDKVEQFDNICEVQSDKASVTITSRYDGIIKKLHYKIDEVALVGQALVDIEVEDDNVAETTPVKIEETTAETIETEVETKNQTGKVLATPAVRRISMQHNVDLSTVTATGRDGRVLKEDILKHINMTSNDSNNVKKEIHPKDVTSIKYEQRLDENLKTIEAEKIVPITGFTKAMTKMMNLSLKIPHFVYSDEIDVSKLVQLRSDLKAEAAARGVALSYMPFLIKAASFALAKFPIINSSIDENCENIIYKSSHNIGVAMDTPKGLIVPNIKNVQRKTILQIATELNALQTNGAKGSLTPEHLTGATFTLSNIGVIGGTYTKPVIMTPQVSIGAIGKIQVLPRFDKDDNVVKTHVMCVSWSADHRIIDGVTMASFSKEWKYYIENPNHFILDL